MRQKKIAAMSAAYPATPQSTDESAYVLDALHCLRVAITVFDSHERLVFANEHFGYIFRALPPPPELLGRRYDELIRLEIAGGDIATLQEDVEAYVARRRAQLFARDYGTRDIALSDGRIIEMKTRRTPQLGWIALWSDVTESRRNLDRLNAAIALSADAFAFYDRYDRLKLCNGEYAHINSAASPSELIGLTFSEIAIRVFLSDVPKGDPQVWLTKRKDIHGQAAGAMTMEFADGRAFLIRDRACSDGGRIVVFTDVTEHHRVERALAEQTRALDDTRKALAIPKPKARCRPITSPISPPSLIIPKPLPTTPKKPCCAR